MQSAADDKVVDYLKNSDLSPSRTALLLLGCHRSGTSAAARLLNLAGAQLPLQMIGGSESNQRGHWEPRPIALMNDAILERHGLAWHDWQPLDFRTLPAFRQDRIVDDIAQEIDRQFPYGSLIMLKDPRICRLTRPYLDAFDRLGYRVVPVLVLRNPLEVMASLMSRQNWPSHMTELDAALLWLSHVLEAEHATRGMARDIWFFDQVMRDTDAVLEGLGERTGVELPVKLDDIRAQIAEFLAPSLRHQRHVTEDLSHNALTIGWLRETLDAMRLLSEAGESDHAHSTLDRVAVQYRAAAPMLVQSRKDRDTMRSAAAEKERELEIRLCETAEAQAAAEEGRREAKAELTNLRSAATELERALHDRLRAAAAQAKRETAALRAAIEAAEVSGSAARDGQRQAEAELAAARAEYAALKDQADLDKAQLEELRQRVDRVEDVAARYRGALEKFRGQVVDIRRLSVLQRQLEATSVELAAIRQSTSWRVTQPLRSLRLRARRNLQRAGTLRQVMTIKGGLLSTAWAAGRILFRSGPAALTDRVREHHRRRVGTVTHLHDSASSGDFVNARAPFRSQVLLSGWHRAVIAALSAPLAQGMDAPTLGLSLVTYNSARWLPGFFNGLRAQEFPLSRLNICFVDHGSTDDTVALIEAEFAELAGKVGSARLFRRENLGFGAGHDFAIRQLADDFVMVSNIDTLFHAGSISRIFAAALADEGDVAAWELGQRPYEHPKYYDPVTLETSWNSHACVLLRRQAYEAVGGYDPRIFMYGEDVELSYRLRSQGWRLRYLPQVSLTHFVDFKDDTLRPHQLSGSLSANVLLRHRYGGRGAGVEGEKILRDIAAAEVDQVRRDAIRKAEEKVSADKPFYGPVSAVAGAAFPFRGLDYDMVREGHDIVLGSASDSDSLPLLSIVTRTHGPKLSILSEAIVSVLNQSYPRIEHLVVEDRTDFAEPLVARVAEGYPGRSIRYLRSNGKGRSRAGNFGLENASGSLLMFLDNDDLLFADHAETLIHELVAHPGAAGAFSLAWDVRTAFAPDGSYREVSHSVHAGHRRGFDRARFLIENYIPIQSMIFRREVFEAEGGFDEHLDYLEDWNLWSRYALHGDFRYLPKVTSLYRTPDDEIVRSLRQGDLDIAYLPVQARIKARYAEAKHKELCNV